ncbi:uncharacterized protein Tco025E_03322 [Trypanosoma conorhini]|uniref:GATOR2 complex protein MIO zinc-ribbon like domain-containing protein n=1 Tax=Trypanosoma conorhini TaxID=83891 RepID=A0A422PUX3_9TRYP|nr:uncharacterized protein Tco025E_03322 [Trypanosoma conorhini]RNF21520.1 hypothetical protein Tco025E_03322 [Trypanosoma conorhini]
MKYFACQPDSHNGFGLLIGHTLTYFAVECGGGDDGAAPAASSSDEGALRVRAQHRVTLPHDFGTAPQCFSMANRSLYGFDMAVVGAGSGVLAVVVMPNSGVVYFPGRNPASLRAPTTAAAADRQGEHRAAPQPQSHSSASTVGPSSLSSPLLGQPAEVDRGVGTITWMRDKPLVFVGFTSGRVAWYHVTLAFPAQLPKTTAGHADAALCAASEPVANFASGAAGGGYAFPSSTWMQSSFARRGGARRTHENGDGEGVRVRLQLSCAFQETGSFLTSDWFPATGFVVAGAERAVYVFSTEQPGAPLCAVTNIGCSFLACHPFLPILACLSFGRSADNGTRPDACALHVFEWTAGGTLSLAAERRTLHKAPRHDVYYGCSWKFAADRQLAICNLEEGTVHLLHLAKAEEGLEAVPQEEDAGNTAAPRPVYTFTRERERQLPLHSLVNIEFLSAARGAWLREHPLTERMPQVTGARGRGHRPPDGNSAARKAGGRRGAGDRRRCGREGGVGCGRPTACFCAAADEDAGVRQGLGVFSRIVGVNCAGEVTATPVDEDATLAILGPGRFAVGFCASVFVAGGEADPLDVEQRMRRRLAAGFGVPAAANVQALRACVDAADVDLRVLCAYVSILETVGAVGSSGPVPSIAELLSLANAPNTTKLMALNLLPHGITVVCGSSTSPNDARRLLLLHLLDWIPPEQEPASRDAASAYATCEQVERAVAVEVLHNQRPRAVALLQRRQQLNPAYATLARLLEHPEFICSTLRSGATAVQECFLSQLSPWLQVVFLYDMDRTKIYANAGLPLWDRVAIAVITECDTARLFSILSSAFAPECSMLQQLLLLEGISESTCPLMQRIVDCTGDFQLAACLFARIGACTAAPSPAAAAAAPPNLVPRCRMGAAAGERAIGATQPGDSAHPWELWAAAYRAFLNDEGEFVKRTMFDLACRQLRELHLSQLTPPTSQQEQQLPLGQLGAPPHARDPFQPPLPGSLPDAAAQIATPATPQQRLSAYPLLSSDRRHCSVCSSLVPLWWQCAQDSLAWCTACRHGGHASHLQEWFLTHRKCPVSGCSCRCEQVGIEPYGEEGRRAPP